MAETAEAEIPGFTGAPLPTGEAARGSEPEGGIASSEEGVDGGEDAPELALGAWLGEGDGVEIAAGGASTKAVGPRPLAEEARDHAATPTTNAAEARKLAAIRSPRRDWGDAIG